MAADHSSPFQLFRRSSYASAAYDPEEAESLVASLTTISPKPRKKETLRARLAKKAHEIYDSFDKLLIKESINEPKLQNIGENSALGASQEQWADDDDSRSYNSDSDCESSSACDCSECERESRSNEQIQSVMVGKIEHLVDRATREVFAYDVQSPVFVGFLREDGTLEKLYNNSESSIVRMPNPERRGPLLPDPTLAHIREVAALSSLDEAEATKVFWEAQRSLAAVPGHIAVMPLADGGRVYRNRRTGEVSDRHPNHEKYVAFFAQHTPPSAAAAAAAAAVVTDGDAADTIATAAAATAAATVSGSGAGETVLAGPPPQPIPGSDRTDGSSSSSDAAAAATNAA